MTRLFGIIASLFLPAVALGFTKLGTVYTTDGSQADVEAAIADSSTGDTVGIPAGSFTWGAGGTAVAINKAITLNGAGQGQTIINLSSTGAAWSAGVIRLTAPATVKNFTINGASSGHVAAFAAGSSPGWRITGIDFNGATDSAYFLYAGTYGLIDNCSIDGNSGSSELIFGRGPADSWQTPSSMGTANAVYIEDCVFGGQGYVCDANSNARFVVRFCTINGPQKIDGHGLASNSPARGVRHMEIYGNQWTNTGLYYAAIELRGGTGMVFDNKVTPTLGNRAHFMLKEYGCTSLWPNFGSVYQTPANYPIKDQVGLGMDPKAGGSEPMYLINNRKDTVDWEINWYNDLTQAIAFYGSPFTIEDDIIVADRDFFKHTLGVVFDGSSGVGRGTAAQMAAITPTLTGVGFWVTDEGEWDSTNGATADGRLYKWNGSAWVLHYTPYTYPHPLRSVVSYDASNRAKTRSKRVRLLR